MKLFIFFYLSQSLLCTSVCGDHGGPQDDDHDRHDHQRAEAKASDQIAQANVQFSDKLYSHLVTAHPNGNLLYSPFTISGALSLMSLGANSKTRDQIREGLGLKNSLMSEETMNKGNQKLLNIIKEINSDIALDMTNTLFIDNTFTILDKFLDDAKKFYRAEVIPTDIQNTEEAVKLVKLEKTDGKMEDFLGNPDPQTVALVNSIFFKGSWEHPFNVTDTREDFNVDEETVVTVPMMTGYGEYPVVVLPDIGCTVVDVPYKGNFSAIFILPEEGKLHDVEKALNIGNLESWRKLMRPKKMFLSIPKFNISSGLELVKELQALGMTEMFSNRADLSRMTGESGLKVSRVVHRAALNMDEGTKASAPIGLVLDFDIIVRYTVNDPFMVAIVNKDNSMPLLMGRITNPNE